GGTKVAWGGQPPAPERLQNRQRFDLVPPAHGDLSSEVDRLVSLGATRLDTGGDGTVTLADPDGNRFCVLPPRETTATSETERAMLFVPDQLLNQLDLEDAVEAEAVIYLSLLSEMERRDQVRS